MATAQKPAAKSSTKVAPKAPIGNAINIGINDKDRAAIAKGLSHLLADSYTLYLTTHNVHSNVTRPMFACGSASPTSPWRPCVNC